MLVECEQLIEQQLSAKQSKQPLPIFEYLESLARDLDLEYYLSQDLASSASGNSSPSTWFAWSENFLIDVNNVYAQIGLS